MAKGFINDSTLTAIANAIRAKLETSDKMLPGDMAGLIAEIVGDVEMTSGDYALSAAQYSGFNIAHGLSGIPYIYCVYTTAGGTNQTKGVVYWEGDGRTYVRYSSDAYSTTDYAPTATHIRVPRSCGAGSYKWCALRLR